MQLQQSICTQLFHLVEREAKRLASRMPNHVLVDDLIGAGSIGLVLAVRQHVDKPVDEIVKLAKRRVRGAMLDHLRGTDPLTRRQRAAVSAVGQVKRRLHEAGEDADPARIAKELGMTKRRAETIESRLCGVQIASIDDTAPVAACDESSPAALLLQRELSGRLATALAEKSARVQTLLSLYYHESLTYQEIADVLGISRSRVCQLHNQAVEELRATLLDDAAA